MGDFRAGQEVRLEDHQRGWIVEIDDGAARVELNDGGKEKWVLLEDLERLERWDNRRRRTA